MINLGMHHCRTVPSLPLPPLLFIYYASNNPGLCKNKHTNDMANLFLILFSRRSRQNLPGFSQCLWFIVLLQIRDEGNVMPGQDTAQQKQWPYYWLTNFWPYGTNFPHRWKDNPWPKFMNHQWMNRKCDNAELVAAGKGALHCQTECKPFNYN